MLVMKHSYLESPRLDSSDEDESDDLDLNQFVEVTNANFDTIYRRVEPDPEFDLSRADPRVGDKNEYLSNNTTPLPYSYFSTMFDPVLSKMTIDTNVMIFDTTLPTVWNLAMMILFLLYHELN